VAAAGISSGCRNTPAFVLGQLAPKSAAVQNLEPGGMAVPRLRRLLQQFENFYGASH
jgi:hypothetical protein